MSLNLTKGQTIDLNKESNKVLKNLRLGAGWDVAEGKTIDLDLWLIPKGGQPLYFNNKEIAGAKLDKDDRSGESSKDGADENIVLHVDALDKEEYVVMINIYDAVTKGQFFKDVKRAFVEIEDVDTKSNVFTYGITENGGDNSALVVGKLVKKNGGLEFTAMSEFSSKDAGTICQEVGATV